MVTHDRYHRQRLVDGIGDVGQDAICDATVAIVGVGALGCMNASLLTRAGVGHLILIDRDIVELTNLQRQVLFTEEDANTHRPKAVAAKKHLLAANNEVKITTCVENLNAKNIDRILSESQIVIDGLDNFNTRYLLNDYAVKTKTPYMFAGVISGQGNAMTILQGRPCLRCLFPDPPPMGSQDTCDTAGVLSPAIGIAASCQTMDAIKFLSGNSDKISSTLLTFDVWNTQSSRMNLGNPKPDCTCCNKHVFEFLDNTTEDEAVALCGKNAVHVPGGGAIDIKIISEKLSQLGTFVASDYVVRGTLHEERGDSGQPIKLLCFHDGRIIVHGTDDVGRAKAICDRFLGN